ncbi:MAG TPA: tetratricopeptide repeat protein [Gemmatimonadaceae bacterium]|nr:tetratricopeptide repeat protein [Gemmatimonadaceae bacterium]
MADRLGDLRERRAALEARLGAPQAAGELDALKAEIGGLFKNVEQDIANLTVLRDEVLHLVAMWKGVKAGSAQPSLAPQFTGEKPVVHADHIGASTFIEKGWSRISLGEYENAEQALNKALELSPGDPQAESLLGWAQMLQDKFDDALLNFQKVLIREPQNALARINVGYICLKKGIFGEAIEHLSRAIRLGNDKKAMLYAHFYLGLVYLERDMFEDAQNFFQKTIALGPNLIEAYFELGRAYWFNGQRDEAMSTWKAGFAANKFNPWGKRCADVLKTVEEGGEP